MGTELATAGREFARKFTSTLCELHLQNGIHRRIETVVNDFSVEHPNLRATYLSREVDDCYFDDPLLPAGAAGRPRMHGLAVDGDQLHEFVAFAHGLRTEVVPLESLVSIQETWTEPAVESPFVLRVVLSHRCGAITVLLATTGETQDLVRDFVARIKYLRGW